MVQAEHLPRSSIHLEQLPEGRRRLCLGSECSRYDSARVKQMIEHEKSKYGWEFLFLGANIDAVETAKHFGISEDRAVNYHSDSVGTRLNYEVVSCAITSMRSGAPMSADWKAPIEADYKTRKGEKN